MHNNNTAILPDRGAAHTAAGWGAELLGSAGLAWLLGRTRLPRTPTTTPLCSERAYWNTSSTIQNNRIESTALHQNVFLRAKRRVIGAVALRRKAEMSSLQHTSTMLPG